MGGCRTSIPILPRWGRCRSGYLDRLHAALELSRHGAGGRGQDLVPQPVQNAVRGCFTAARLCLAVSKSRCSCSVEVTVSTSTGTPPPLLSKPSTILPLRYRRLCRRSQRAGYAPEPICSPGAAEFEFPRLHAAHARVGSVHRGHRPESPGRHDAGIQPESAICNGTRLSGASGICRNTIDSPIGPGGIRSGAAGEPPKPGVR